MKRALFVCFLCLFPALCRADTATDVVTGTGSPGPYTLSWKGILSGTETVQVGALPQTRGIDYTVDADAGTVTFTRPLPAPGVASVRYEYDPAHAVRTGNAPVIPLAIDLARAGQSSLALSACLRPGDAGGSSPTGPLSVGIGGGLRGAGGGVGAQIVYAPAMSSAGPQKASDASRAGAAVSGDVGRAGQPLHLSAGWTRAGTNVADAGEGMTAGQQTLTAKVDAAPMSNLSASAGVTQTAALTGNAGSSGPVTTVTTASVQAAPVKTAQIGANFTSTNAPGTSADATAAGVTASLAPVQTVSLNASLNVSQQGTQDVQRQAAGVTLSPSSALSLNAGVGERDAGASAFTFTTVGASVRPVRGLELSGTYTGRDAAPDDTQSADGLDSTAARVALSPFGNALRLTGSYAQNPDGGGDFARALAQRGLGLETQVGALALSGGYNWTRDLSVPGDAGGGTAFNVNMGLRLSGATQLTGGCTQTLQGLAANASGTNLYTLGLSHAVGSSVSLSLSGTMQAPVNSSPAALPAAPQYTANAALGLRF